MEIDIEAPTFMLRRYSRWIGDTLRSIAWLRSIAAGIGLDKPNRSVVDVGNFAFRIEDIQGASLRRDVRRREMQPEIGRHAAAIVLGEHLATAVGCEAVDLDAVVSGKPAHLGGEDGADGRHILGGLQTADRLLQALELASGAECRKIRPRQ